MDQDRNHAKNRARTGPKVLLTDTNRWPGPARLAIGLAKAGCRVFGVCPRRGHPLLYARAVERTFPYGSIRPLEALRAAIETVNPQIVVPCDDRSVQHLHELYVYAKSTGASGDGLANLIEYSLGRPENFPITTSRADLLRVATEEGIRVPRTKPLTSIDDLDSWENEPFPWVLKGDGTFGGRGVRIAENPLQAKKYFSDITGLFGLSRAIKRAAVNRDPFWLRPWWENHRPAVIVQSHIKGRPANCAVFCWKGTIKAGIGVEVVNSDGQTGPASVVRLVDNPEMMFAAERIARRLGLSGCFGLDFMIEEGSGATYLIEMNPRSTPLSHLQLGRGRDLVEALAAELTNQPIMELPSVTQNDLIAYFPQAWNSKNELWSSCFQDIPKDEPDLVSALMRPWPERSLLFRLASKVSFLKSSA